MQATQLHNIFPCNISKNEFNYPVVWIEFNTKIFLLNFIATKNFELTDNHL